MEINIPKLKPSQKTSRNKNNPRVLVRTVRQLSRRPKRYRQKSLLSKKENQKEENQSLKLKFSRMRKLLSKKF